MIIDWRALCVDLVDWADYTSAHYYAPPEVLVRARAALAEADEPAVSDGREPASVVEQPTDAELLDIAAQAIGGYSSGIKLGEYEAENEIAVEAYGSELITFARAVLARWGQQFAPPPAWEVEELVAELRSTASGWESHSYPQNAALITRAADMLERQHPQPVPVSERLPGPEDCDAEGRCWWYGEGGDMVGWTLDAEGPSYYRAKYWLPAHALQAPAGGATNG